MNSDERAIVEQGAEWARLEAANDARRKLEAAEDEVRFNNEFDSTMESIAQEIEALVGQVEDEGDLVDWMVEARRLRHVTEQELQALADEDEDLADESLGCPACGNRATDWLCWQRDDTLFCCRCGVTYTS